MSKLVYVNDNGRSIEFSLASGYVIGKLSDPSSQAVSFSTSAGAYDVGVAIEAQNVGAKSISISGTLVGACDDKKADLLKTIVPMIGASIILDDMYTLRVYPKNTPVVERYSHNAQFNFTLYAPFPYWSSVTPTSVDLMGINKMFMFPWNSGIDFYFSQVSGSYYVNAYNEGSVPSRWKIELMALSPLTNPKIENVKTGDYVRILKSMTTGERIVIDTTGAELTVKGYLPSGVEYQAFSYLDINSTPFQLDVGDNLIKADCAANRAGLSAKLIMTACYAGVA